MEQVESLLNGVFFRFREKIGGGMNLRRRAPRVVASVGENALYESLIQRAFPDEKLRQSVRQVFDVGCRDWSYAPAIARAFSNACLKGVELDGNRRYWNLYRRRDYAQAWAETLRQTGRDVDCEFKDFRQMVHPENELASRGENQAFLFFFPFVSENPCLKWGLPLEYSNFAALLEHTKSLMRPGTQTWILSAHQGDWEAESAKKAYDQAGLVPSSSVLESQDFPYPVHLWIAQVTT